MMSWRLMRLWRSLVRSKIMCWRLVGLRWSLEWLRRCLMMKNWSGDWTEVLIVL